MAKRTTPRSQANDAATAAPPQPKARRPRGRAAAEPDTLGAFPDVERTENDDAALNAASGNNQPASARSQASDETGGSTWSPAQSHSSSMGSEPSDEDIRVRAYQRYLERGGSHGMDFEDWLAAERELKTSK
jgi:hypothetical protein